MIPQITDVSFLLMDFDGVFTNNKVLTFSNGMECISCCKRDSLGLSELRKKLTYLKHNIYMAVITKEKNSAVKMRCKKLGLTVFTGVDDKLECFLQIVNKERRMHHLQGKVVYIGNDINDIDCMNASDFSFAPVDSDRKVLTTADHVLTSKGGDGAIREMIDILIGNIQGV